MRLSLLKPAAGILAVVILAACSAGRTHGGQSGNVGNGSAAVSAASSFAPVSDVAAEAQRIGVTPGRVALGEIICRLDSSNVLEDLVAKNASRDLLEILRETALQKSTTLEALDEKYGLTAILASEGIFVSISSNGVMTQSEASHASVADSDWLPRFQTAISAAGS